MTAAESTAKLIDGKALAEYVTIRVLLIQQAANTISFFVVDRSVPNFEMK